MRYLIYAVLCILAIVGGYGLTLICYMVGFVQPALFLASLIADDKGGDTLLTPFLIINTILYAIPVYVLLAWVSGGIRRRLYGG